MMGLIAVPFLTLWIGALFAALGLLFAPVAAIYCRRSARLNGLNARRYALMGGVYSLMFFAPAIYLLARLRGRNVPNGAVIAAYVILYSYWLLGPIGLAILMAAIGVGAEMCIALFLIWIASAVHVILSNQETWRSLLNSRAPAVPGYIHIVPFLLAYASSVASILFPFAAESWLMR